MIVQDEFWKNFTILHDLIMLKNNNDIMYEPIISYYNGIKWIKNTKYIAIFSHEDLKLLL